MSVAIGSGGRRLGRALRGLVTGRSTERSADRAGGSLPEEPLLSVVVPVYQVESYLAECLDSVLGQRYPHLEVLLIDDGSTDGSAEIARAYAERDSRVRVVRQDNAGLGAARNRGIRESTGDLVTFVDSDDTVTPGGWSKMVRTLRQTGSDFAVGSIRRQVRGRYVERHWLRKLHAEPQLAITIDDAPGMLGNIWAVTKVFRSDFLARTGLTFPVGVRYEDQVPITRAYLEASSFDVLTDAVYLWRTRVEGTSITQQKHQANDLRDRLAAKQQVADLLDQGASELVVGQWFTKVFRLDLMPYFRAALTADESYWTVLTTATAWLVEHAPAATWDSLELRFRVAARLAARRDRDALTRLFAVHQLDTSNFESVLRDGHLVADVDLGLPPGPATDEMLRLTAVDLPSSAQLDDVTWSDDGQVTLRGVAFVRHLPPARYDVTTTLRVLPPSWSGADRVDVPAVQEESVEANRFARRVFEDHRGSGFAATIDVRRLVRASDPARPTPWRVSVDVDAAGVTGRGWFAHRNDVGTARAVHARLVDGALVVDSWHRRLGWQVTVHARHAAVLAVDVVDEHLRLRVHVGAGAAPVRVLREDQPVETRVTADPGAPQVHEVEVALADLAGPLPAPLRLDCGDDRSLPLVAAFDLDGLGLGDATGTDLATAADRSLLLAPRVPHVVLDEVEPGATSVRVTGRAVDVEAFRLRLAGSRANGSACEIAVTDGRFSAEVPTTFDFWDRATSPLWRDLYALEARSGDREIPVRAARTMVPPGQRHGWRVRVSPLGGLALRRVKDVDPDPSSSHGRQVLRTTVYADAQRGPRSDAVVFESFGGAGTDGDPGALARALQARDPDREVVWSVADAAIPVPAGSRAVVQGTAPWFEAVGRAGTLVTNGTFPRWFTKAEDQVLVQTWRGTALRRLGADVNDVRVLDEDDELLEEQARQWDLLVTPNAFTSAVITKALGFLGPVAEIGSPRNDRLLAEGADVLRAVLYAPTWRENARARGHHEKVLLAEPADLAAGLADTVVLVRGHPNTAPAASVSGAGVVDVTTYPDLAELFLAADVLVSDHSAVLFDFVLTDKPVVLMAPDLEEYQAGDRGLYVDLLADAPGPVLTTLEQLVPALEAGDAHAEDRHRMREAYGELEDGGATRRLLERLFPAARD